MPAGILRERKAIQPMNHDDDPKMRAYLAEKRADEMTITCGSHGKRRWRGDVVCSACGRILDIKAHDRGAGITQTVMCKCGAVLVSNDPTVAFTGRVICNYCARQYRKQHGGIVPRDRIDASNAELAARDAAKSGM